MGQFALSQSIPRTEDPRLLRGGGRYAADFALPHMAHAVFVRSPHAHARITGIDVRAAQQMPGVLAVLTGQDWREEGFGDAPPGYPRTRRDGSPLFQPLRPALVRDRARMVGDPIAMVVAETLDAARDAAERVVIEYEPLPVLTDATRARASGAPMLHEGCSDNESFFFKAGDARAVEAAFAKAAHVTRLRLRINRVTANTMEPRACVGHYVPAEDRYTLYGGTQRAWGLRHNLAEHVFKVPEHKVRVVTGDIGGSFGMKTGGYPEYLACLWASARVRRPVKWVCERSEGHLSDSHDRDQTTEAALALDAEGRFLAMRFDNVCGVGAYLGAGAPVSPSNHLGGLAGLYTTPAIYVEASAVFTNTAPIGPYRGAGRPEATYVLERLIDTAAREIGLDRAEIRRRNLIPSQAMPFKTGLTFTYDCGDFPRNMSQALATADYAGFETRRAAAAARGRLRGIGIANFVEQTGQADGEVVSLKFDAAGCVTVAVGSIPQGQGHETMYKVIISDRLGIDADDIRVVTGDTDAIPYGWGTYSSRSAALGSAAAVVASDKVIAKARLTAAHLLEAADADIEFKAGAFRVAGTDRTIALKDVVRASFDPRRQAPGVELGLFETGVFHPHPPTPTFPNGCQVCEVEIDPGTGRAEIVRYCVVDDVGTVINKLTLEGQIHGGIGQGVGQAFSEAIVYDENGQLLSGSFLDYGMPRADNMCAFECANNPVPTKNNPLGVKGAGEAGNVGALACIMNAVVDALAPLGITHIDMPATPEKVWRAIKTARAPA
ncbi:MAG TPA: xanthine dehydrogenase family protein molybdopterin-binding subunit [Stellaceae bacterium]|jgi:carbon-monoxide dehydrogenase large subunit